MPFSLGAKRKTSGIFRELVAAPALFFIPALYSVKYQDIAQKT